MKPRETPPTENVVGVAHPRLVRPSSFIPCAVMGLDARKIHWWLEPYESGKVKINPADLAALQALLRPQRVLPQT